MDFSSDSPETESKTVADIADAAAFTSGNSRGYQVDERERDPVS